MKERFPGVHVEDAQPEVELVKEDETVPPVPPAGPAPSQPRAANLLSDQERERQTTENWLRDKAAQVRDAQVRVIQAETRLMAVGPPDLIDAAREFFEANEARDRTLATLQQDHPDLG